MEFLSNKIRESQRSFITSVLNGFFILKEDFSLSLTLSTAGVELENLTINSQKVNNKLKSNGINVELVSGFLKHIRIQLTSYLEITLSGLSLKVKERGDEEMFYSCMSSFPEEEDPPEMTFADEAEHLTGKISLETIANILYAFMYGVTIKIKDVDIKYDTQHGQFALTTEEITVASGESRDLSEKTQTVRGLKLSYQSNDDRIIDFPSTIKTRVVTESNLLSVVNTVPEMNVNVRGNLGRLFESLQPAQNNDSVPSQSTLQWDCSLGIETLNLEIVGEDLSTTIPGLEVNLSHVGDWKVSVDSTKSVDIMFKSEKLLSIRCPSTSSVEFWKSDGKVSCILNLLQVHLNHQNLAPLIDLVNRQMEELTIQPQEDTFVDVTVEILQVFYDNLSVSINNLSINKRKDSTLIEFPKFDLFLNKKSILSISTVRLRHFLRQAEPPKDCELPALYHGKFDSDNQIMFLETLSCGEYEDFEYYLKNRVNFYLNVKIISVEFNLTMDDLMSLVKVELPKLSQSSESGGGEETTIYVFDIKDFSVTFSEQPEESIKISVKLPRMHAFSHNLPKDGVVSPLIQGYVQSDVKILINENEVVSNGGDSGIFFVWDNDPFFETRIVNYVLQLQGLKLNARFINADLIKMINRNVEKFREAIPYHGGGIKMPTSTHICLKDLKYNIINDFDLSLNIFVSLYPQEYFIFIENIKLSLYHNCVMAINYIMVNIKNHVVCEIRIVNTDIFLCSDSLSKLILFVNLFTKMQEAPSLKAESDTASLTASEHSCRPITDTKRQLDQSSEFSVISFDSDKEDEFFIELTDVDCYEPNVLEFSNVEDFVVEDFIDAKGKDRVEPPTFFPFFDLRIEVTMENFSVTLFGGSDLIGTREINNCVVISLKLARLVYELPPVGMRYSSFVGLSVFGFGIRGKVDSMSFTRLLYFYNKGVPSNQNESFVVRWLTMSSLKDVNGGDDTVSDNLLRISSSAINITVDQNSIVFLNKFLSSLVEIESDDTEDLENCIFFKDVKFFPQVEVTFSYLPNWNINELSFDETVSNFRISVFKLLFAFASINKSQIILKPVNIKYGISGIKHVVEAMVNQWIGDIRENQLGTIISSVGSLSSIKQILSGVGSFVSLSHVDKSSLAVGLRKESTELGNNIAVGVSGFISSAYSMYEIWRQRSEDASGRPLRRISEAINSIFEKIKDDLESRRND